MRVADAFELVGNTPCIRVPANGHDKAQVYVKLEGFNPTGSVKDRACVELIRDKVKSEELRPGMTILDASSGNMACSIAYYGKILGYETRVFSNSKLTEDKKAFIEYYGASVDIVGTFTIEGNRACRAIAEEEPERYCFLDQLHNWANPRAHHESTGPEILNEFPDLAMVVASLGSGGTMCGVGKFLKEKKPHVKLVAVEAQTGTRLPGTGAFVDGDYVTPFMQRSFDEGVFDRRIRITYEEAVEATEALKEVGVFTGLQTGGVYRAALNAVRAYDLRGEVVIISGDSGWKNMHKLTTI